MGMRPLTPDGLPVIGRVPGLANVFLATGHAMLGITLAPVTGAAIAGLVAGQTSGFDLTPFDPARFVR
jgi:D-amino-acid dehydrogenase